MASKRIVARMLADFIRMNADNINTADHISLFDDYSVTVATPTHQFGNIRVCDTMDRLNAIADVLKRLPKRWNYGVYVGNTLTSVNVMNCKKELFYDWLKRRRYNYSEHVEYGAGYGSHRIVTKIDGVEICYYWYEKI